MRPEAGEFALRRGRRIARLAQVEGDADAVDVIDALQSTDAEVDHVVEMRDRRVAEQGVADGAEDRAAPDALEGVDLDRDIVAARAEPLLFVAGGELELSGEADAGAIAAAAGIEGVSRRCRRVAEPAHGAPLRLCIAALRRRQVQQVVDQVAVVDAADAGDHRARTGDPQVRQRGTQRPSVTLVARRERERPDACGARAAVIAAGELDAAAEGELALSAERRPREAQREDCKEGAHQRPWRSGFSGRSWRSGRSARSWRASRSWRSARIASPTLMPMLWAISPHPLPSAPRPTPPPCCP